VDDLRRHLAALPPVEVVYTDLDGTLLGRDGSVLSDADGRPDAAAAVALVEASRAGVAVVAVSGRRAGSLAADVRLLGLSGGIAEVGAVVLRDGRHLLRWGEAPRDLGPTPRAALDAAGAVEALLGAFPGDLRPFAPWDAGREGGHLLHGRVDVPAADAVLAAAGAGWARLVDNGRAGGWPGRDDVRAYHLVPRGVGKAAAIAEDLRDRGVAPAAAVAVGDSAEDLTMAGAVGTYVAVADGHAGSAAGCFRTAGRAGAGVAEVLGAVLAARADRP
jgi:phosphoglycolate phosphatase